MGAQVPVPASVKSSPVAPCVTTAVEPRVPPFTKTKVSGVTELGVPMLTDPKFAGGGAATCGAVTVRERVVDAIKAPDLPVMVMFCVPVGALVAAVNVRTALVEVVFGLKVAVTEDGRPEAARLTLPVNPFNPVTAIVEVEEIP